MKKRYLFIIGIATIFIWFFAQLPASAIIQFVDNKDLKVARVSGSIWNAKLHKVSFKGFDIDELEINPKLRFLIFGELAAYIVASKDKSKASGIISRSSSSNDFLLQNFTVDFDSSLLNHFASNKNVLLHQLNPKYTLSGVISKLNWNNELKHVQANLAFSNIELKQMAISGSLKTTISTQDDLINAKIRDTKNTAIKLDLSFNYHKNKQYDYQLALGFKDITPRKIKNLLSLLGLRTKNDVFRLRNKGKLTDLKL